MFSFFKKSNIITDIAWLGIDIHSHVLPGIDDGSSDMEQTIIYIKALQNLGFDTLHCTPHIFQELYPNSSDTILPVLGSVKEHLVKNNINLMIGAAAEYMVDSYFEPHDNLLCLPGNHILIEMSYLSESPNIENIIFNLQVKGYRVVLAHPERYNFYHKDLQRYHRLKEMGCLFQLNLLSCVGYYGNKVQHAYNYLLEKKLYDVAGTDLHHDRHLSLLTKVIQNGQLYKLIGNYEFMNRELFAV